VRTVLLTDEPQVSRHPLAADFDELIEIEPPCQAKPAAEIDKTHFARCFAQIIDWLESARGPFLLWCHLAGLGTTWDAPLQFRQRYCEPGDPPPPETADVPDRLLPADYDPDDLFGITQAYAGQVSLLDACLGAFLDFLDDRPSRTETLLTITSARGFPLGEHRRIGPCDGALFGETVAVPWLVQLPGGAGAAARSNALVEPSDLWATLREWHGAGSSMDSPTGQDILPLIGGDRENSSVPFRDRICVAGRDGRRAIRTPAWYLLDGAEAELFAKPDDRWEANNVASRCQDVVEELRRALADYEAVLSSNGRVAELPPLDGALLYGLE
jgi:arylsulfatase A-like enzyme